MASKSPAALSRERDAMLGLLERLVRIVHQPNPTDPSRWDVRPGGHRAFCELINDVCVVVVTANCVDDESPQ
jgi:hypothetical protein